MTVKPATKVVRGDHVQTTDGYVAVLVVTHDSDGVELIGPGGCMMFLPRGSLVRVRGDD